MSAERPSVTGRRSRCPAGCCSASCTSCPPRHIHLPMRRGRTVGSPFRCSSRRTSRRPNRRPARARSTRSQRASRLLRSRPPSRTRTESPHTDPGCRTRRASTWSRSSMLRLPRRTPPPCTKRWHPSPPRCPRLRPLRFQRPHRRPRRCQRCPPRLRRSFAGSWSWKNRRRASQRERGARRNERPCSP